MTGKLKANVFKFVQLFTISMTYSVCNLGKCVYFAFIFLLMSFSIKHQYPLFSCIMITKNITTAISVKYTVMTIF